MISLLAACCALPASPVRPVASRSDTAPAAVAPAPVVAPIAAPIVAPIVAPVVAPAPAALRLAAADTGRPRAIEYSDAYATRLTIHRYASYAVLPVFAGEYILGNKLINDQEDGRPTSDGTKNAHAVVAGVLGGLFAVNTVTGVWNLWDARHDPDGRARRIVHSALMLAADGGFAATGLLADRAGRSNDGADTHRNVALASMGVSVVGGALMYLWKD